MISINFELNRKAKKNGQFPVYLRVTENAKHYKMVLDVYVTSQENFASQAKRNNWVSQRERYHKLFNERLRNILDKAEDIKTELDRRGELNAQVLIDILKRKDYGSFIKYIEEKKEQLEKRKRMATAYNVNVIRVKLLCFNKNKDVTFNQITSRFISRFVDYLFSEELKDSSVREYIIRFHTLYNKAKAEKLILTKTNPFEDIHIKKEDARKAYLTLDEIRLIENLPLVKNTNLWHVRNYFLFAFYAAGMRIGDLIKLKWENIQNEHIEYTMHKTKHYQSIWLLPEARHILNLYLPLTSDRKDNHVFPISISYKPRSVKIKYMLSQDFEYHMGCVKRNTMGKSLKKIIRKAGINKNISFHSARHSFATLAIKGNNIYTVSSLLGHHDLAVTHKYLHSTGIIQDQYMKSVFQVE